MTADASHHEPSPKSAPDRFCLIDIGSTTTKCAYVRRGQPILRCEAPTTVEQPWEDVRVGVMNCLRHLQQSTGDLLVRDDRPDIPLYATSSAGGGLVMIVAGLVKRVTAASAERAEIGAGAVVRETIALDDGRPPYWKIELLRRLQPDMILLAGGFDQGAEFGPVFLAELLAQADLRCKFDPSSRPPVLFAGNASAFHYVKDILEPQYLCLSTKNIRPGPYRENLEPAHDAVHDIFMEHVMSRAPGYDRFAQWVAAPIMPTPAAMGQLLEVASSVLKKRILAVDIGGATTDVFTAINGRVQRTVSANLGMSYSSLNVVDQFGATSLQTLMQHPVGDHDLLDLVGSKYLRPVRLPETPIEREVECSIAAVAVREAVRAHLRVVQNKILSRGRDGLGYGKEAVETTEQLTNEPIDLRDYDIVIGSGGILSHSPRDTTMAILVNALNPNRPIELAVDADFTFPQLGVLAGIDEESAMQFFHEIGLAPLGRLIPCRGKHKSATVAVEIEAAGTSGYARQSVLCGETAVIGPESAGHEIHIRKKRLKPTETHCVIGRETTPRVIIDARNRPPVASFPWSLESKRRPDARISCEWERAAVTEGAITETRELAVPGEVLVTAGQTVQPETLIAHCTRAFPRPFIVDIARHLGVDAATAQKALSIGIGDFVKVGDRVAEHQDDGSANDGAIKAQVRRFGLIPTRGRRHVTATVSGSVEKILPNGSIVLRETLEQARDVVRVNAAADLQLHPEELKPCLACEIGQEVEKGQALARRGSVTMLGAPRSLAPVRGRVREIDLVTGLIIIEPILEELQVRAWLPGKVTSVSDRGCNIELYGVTLPGIWGRGPQVCGRLVLNNGAADDIVAIPAATHADLESLKAARIAGLVTGSVRLAELRSVQPPYPVVLTEGFGSEPMQAELWARLAAHAKQMIALDPTTRLRAGVVRPRIILPRNNH